MRPVVRDNLAETYGRSLQRGLQQVLTLETEAVRDILDAPNNDYLELERFYDEPMLQHLRGRVRPVQWGFGIDTIKATAVETNLEIDPSDPVLATFIAKYADDFSFRYRMSHFRQLRSLIESPEEIEARLDSWLDREAKGIAVNEKVRQNNSIFKEAVFGQGKSVKWAIRGPSSCLYCKRLNGRRISKGGAFINKMGSLDPKIGDKKPLIFYQGLGNPPAHPHCDCFLNMG